MGRSKKKKVKQAVSPLPKEKFVKQGGNPESDWDKPLSWQFHLCDTEGAWAFSKERIEKEFWEEIFTKLKDFEKMTLHEIFTQTHDRHHPISIETLNKCARDRLQELHRFDDEKIYSLRLKGNRRLYGLIYGSTYCVLWFDKDHGDNDTCVCRSYKKHT